MQQMTTITIIRARSKNGNFGMMLDDSYMPFAVTAELPWLDNEPNVSCIYDGVFLCVRVKSPKYGDTFEITNVRGRSNILFHKLNIPLKESEGCIGVGEKFEDVNGQDAIQDSKHGYDEFMELMKGVDSFALEIITAAG